MFASLHTQPLEDAVARELIRDRLGLRGYPQMLLQLGPAVSAASTPRRPPGELTRLLAPGVVPDVLLEFPVARVLLPIPR